MWACGLDMSRHLRVKCATQSFVVQNSAAIMCYCLQLENRAMFYFFLSVALQQCSWTITVKQNKSDALKFKGNSVMADSFDSSLAMQPKLIPNTGADLC